MSDRWEAAGTDHFKDKKNGAIRRAGRSRTRERAGEKSRFRWPDSSGANPSGGV